MFDLFGKKAVITGASGAIGSQIARSLHAQGAELVLTGTREEPLKKLQDELKERVHIVLCNLDEPSETERLIEKAEGLMGQVDILVNNAGLTRDGLMMRMKDEDWQKVIDVNLTASFRLSRACLRGMMKRRWGRIINISSIVGVTGNPGQTNYAASKAGLIGMSKALASEVASRGITVNCIAPGFIASPMTDSLTDEQKQAINVKIPMGHIGMPEDIAASATYLASLEAQYVTGQTIHVNGGMAMI
jgi:3-oxoacyl-[acyl-carrier protein] reductase